MTTEHTPEMNDAAVFCPEFLAEVASGDRAYPTHGDHSAERLKEWVAGLDGVLSRETATAAARTFPATSLLTFKRWLACRTKFSPAELAAEPLLQADPPDRLGLRPLRFPWIIDEYRKKIEAMHWIAGEVSIKSDPGDLARLDPASAFFVKSIIAFFDVADALVMGCLDSVAGRYLRNMEAELYLAAQANQEATHADSYALMSEGIIAPEERAEIHAAAVFNPAVARMIDWARWWCVGAHSAPDVFVAMSQFEGTLFSGQFGGIQLFKGRGVLRGLTTYNEMIAADENLHADFWCELAARCSCKSSRATVEAIVRETVLLSDAFFAHAMPDGVKGLPLALVKQYVRSVADYVLGRAKRTALYGVANPLPFMDRLALKGKTNFFEGQVTQYQAFEPGALDFVVDFAKIDAPLVVQGPTRPPAAAE